jgi:hypothetical protein
MEQHVNNCWNTNFSFYLETSGGQNSNPPLNVVHFFNITLQCEVIKVNAFGDRVIRANVIRANVTKANVRKQDFL